jgi:hypothetical protein
MMGEARASVSCDDELGKISREPTATEGFFFFFNLFISYYFLYF